MRTIIQLRPYLRQKFITISSGDYDFEVCFIGREMLFQLIYFVLGIIVQIYLNLFLRITTGNIKECLRNPNRRTFNKFSIIRGVYATITHTVNEHQSIT